MKYFLLLFCLCFCETTSCQVIQLGSTQYIRRFDYIYVDEPSIWLDRNFKQDVWSSQSLSADILIHKGFYLNTGFIWQYTYCGFIVEHPDGAGAGEVAPTLWHYQIPLRLKYQQKLFSKWNRSLWLSGTLGVAININKGYNDPWQNGTVGVKSLPASDTRTMYYTYTYNSSFNKTFLLFRGDIELGVDLMPWATVFFRVGHSFGRNRQVQHDVDYWFEDTSVIKGTVYGTGDAFYYGIGIYGKLFPQQNTWKGVFQKMKKKKAT